MSNCVGGREMTASASFANFRLKTIYTSLRLDLVMDFNDRW